MSLKKHRWTIFRLSAAFLGLAVASYGAFAFRVWFSNRDPAKESALSRTGKTSLVFWDSLSGIEQRHDGLPQFDEKKLEALMDAKKFDDAAKQFSDYAATIDSLGDEIRQLPAIDVDQQAVDYSLQLASLYKLEAAYFRHSMEGVWKVKAYFANVSGISAFVTGLFRPDKEIDDIFISGPAEVKNYAKLLAGEQEKVNAEEEKVDSCRASVRVDLTRRYGCEFR